MDDKLFEELLEDFITKKIGVIVVTDAEGNIVRKSEGFGFSEKTEMHWRLGIPEFEDNGKCSEWDFVDEDSQKYYNVTTAVYKTDEGVFQYHFLFDNTECALDRRHNSLMFEEMEKMNEFQETMLRNISEDYSKMLPMIADVFESDEVIIFISDGNNLKELRHSTTDRESIFTDTREVDIILSLKEGEKYKDYICLNCGKVGTSRYALIVHMIPGFQIDRIENLSLINGIKLNIEGGILREQLKYESEHDSQTDLYNKDKYVSLMKDKFGDPETLAIFNLDISNLREVNETLGRDLGDELIMMAAKSIKMMESDRILGFRMGGDKFMMVGMGLTYDEANDFKYRLDECIDKVNYENRDIKLKMKCNVTFGEKTYSLDSLIDEADQFIRDESGK